MVRYKIIIIKSQPLFSDLTTPTKSNHFIPNYPMIFYVSLDSVTISINAYEMFQSFLFKD